MIPSRTFTYFADGRLQKSTDFQGHETIKAYDANGYIKSVTDANTHTTLFTSNPITGNVTLVTYPATASEPVPSTREIVYGGPGCPDTNSADAAGIYYVHKVKDERNNWTTYWRDTRKRVIRIDYPDQDYAPEEIYETFSYYPDGTPGFGQLFQHRMTNGAVETFTYNSRGLVETQTAPAIASVSSPNPTVYTYYPPGDYRGDRVKTVTDPRGKTTTYDYNARGQVTRVTHHDNSYAQSAYNPDGTVAWTADETQPSDPNKRTRYLYDDYKRVTSATNPEGETTTFWYEPWGGTGALSHTSAGPYYVVPPSQKQVHYGYDENLRRLWTRVAGQDAFAGVEYDNIGNLKKFVNFAPPGVPGDVTEFGYDERDRRTSKTDPAPFNNQVTRWEYAAQET